MKILRHIICFIIGHDCIMVGKELATCQRCDALFHLKYVGTKYDDYDAPVYIWERII